MSRSLTLSFLLLGAASCSAADPALDDGADGPAISDVAAVAVSPRNVRLSWHVAGDAELTIERALGDEPFAVVAIRPAARGRWLDLGLTPERSYRYRLRACHLGSCSEPVTTEAVATAASQLPGLDVKLPAADDSDDLIVLSVLRFSLAPVTEGHAAVLDRQGHVMWEYTPAEENWVTEVQPLPDHTLAVGLGLNMVQLDLDLTPVWQPTFTSAEHDFDRMQDGRTILLAFETFESSPGTSVLGDMVRIINRDPERIDWEWRGRDHIPLTDVNAADFQVSPWGLGHDWTHFNSVTFDEPASTIYVNVRNLDRLYAVAYPSGDVRWTMGQGGDFGAGLWFHSHDPEFLEPGHMLVFDNGLWRPGSPPNFSRVIEVEYDPLARTAAIVWEYRETPDFFAFAMGSVQTQPSGNILVATGTEGRVLELTRAKEKTLELAFANPYCVYKAVAVPRSFFTEW